MKKKYSRLSLFIALTLSISLTAQENFDFKKFINPPSEYGPFTRWWWPGNDVEKDELRREVKMFVDNGFGGVEIQPFTTGIKPESSRLNQIYSWDTPAYYSNLTAVMQEAKKHGLIVDLNGGSGWPMSSSALSPSESILSLMVVDTLINSNGTIQMDIPPLRIDSASLWRKGLKTHNDVPNHFYQLINVAASKVIRKSEKIILDPATLFNVPFDRKRKTINWQVPSGGNWCLVFVYVGPGGEKPLYAATEKISWVTDPLNTKSLDKTLNYLLGSRTALPQFYGSPLRAVFMDSKEFIVDRHVSSDFVSYFKKKRGYDISRYLFLNAIKGYDNAYSFGRDTISKYLLTQDDWRIRYDYNKTISELFTERQYKYVSDWLENKGMFHRAQAYGQRGDIISASGMTSIPEAEQLSGNSSDGLVKLVTSGAHLNNKPIIAQESFVFASKTYMTTPQKIRVYANKSFAQGINQIVYHGTAYQYKTDEYGSEGWYPWASPYKSFNYSSNINESNNFWKYMKQVNRFIARSQYALRSGKPKTDVLIYFPFIDFEASQVVLNPHDKVVHGSFDRNEPHFYDPTKISVTKPTKIQQYYIDIWPIINKLEMLGLTWDFVNDAFLQDAKSTDRHEINIRGNIFHTLIVPKIPYVPLSTAKKIKELYRSNTDILVVEKFPDMQPGFSNHIQRDADLRRIFEEVNNRYAVNYILKPSDLDSWFTTIAQPVRFKEQYDFIKQQKRVMPDGSILAFLWNQSAEKKEIELLIDPAYRHSYWMSAENGTIIKNDINSVHYSLEPFEAVILLASKKKLQTGNLNVIQPRKTERPTIEKVISIDRWDIKTGNIEKKDAALFDLGKNSETQFISDEINYVATITLTENKSKKIILDLGNVCYTATVFVNGEKAGDIIWPPYKMDISKQLVSGNNTIKIIVTPTNRNYYVGEGFKQNKYYKSAFQNKMNTLMPAGLMGPVQLCFK